MGLGHSLDSIRTFAREALTGLTRLRVPPAPNNFQLFYWHESGEYPDLSRLMRTLEERGEAFTEDLLEQLHERFFGAEDRAQAIRSTAAQIEGTMERLMERFGGAADETGRYGDELASFRERLAGSPEVSEIRTLVEGILGETRRMQERTEVLETAVVESTREITTLREDLVKAEQAALTDALTRLPNRRHFEEALRTSAATARAEHTPLSLLIADVDHFKAFNDTHGHQVGDQVLRAVAQKLVSNIKGRDLAARFGGEEFAVILAKTPLAGARTVAEQIRSAVASSRVRVRSTGVELGSVTLSIGAAEYQPGESLGAFVGRADRALYGAKQAGRNRVVVGETRGSAAA